MSPITITTHAPELNTAAQALATELGLPFTIALDKDTPFWLLLTTQGLQLCSSLYHKTQPLQVDFLAGRNYHRYRYGGGKRQMIARAVGIKGNHCPSILDITAGLGRDGFVLACLGCNVTLVERSVVLFALLRDGLQRAQQVSWFQKLQLRLQLGDANDVLQQLSKNTYPDVIYCDPMYPDSKQSALVKKEMRIVRDLIGDDLDADSLLPLCLRIAKQRVVVKRAFHAPFLNQQKPTLQYKGKSSRYDVYIVQPRSLRCKR
jgi:16S rRNA (guanine1516-N2)-methyltransferase